MSAQVFDVPVPHDDGRYINERVSRVVEIIHDYDPTLEVCWIPPDKREPGDAAFAIVETVNGKRSVAFYVNTEAEMDERVLSRIFEADTARTDVMARMEAQNRAAEALRLKKQQEEIDDYLEYMETVIKSPLNKYVGRDGQVFRD